MSGGAPLAITGATGFVGQSLLDRIVEAGLPVNALVRRITDHQHDRVEWVTGDLEDHHALDRLVAGTHGVVHIAGLTNTPDPADFARVNVAGTANVLAAARKAGVRRFVFVSSLAAREPQLSRYGASKAEAEELVKASGLDWTIVRPPAVYGPRDADMFELFRAARFGIVPLPPGGATSIIHVQDLARLLITLAMSSSSEAAGLTSKWTFEPDDAREGGWSHKELAQAIGRAVAGRAVLAPHLPRSLLQGAAALDRLVRGNKARLTPDRVGYMCHPNWVVRSDRRVPAAVWTPRIAGEEGLKATADWYRAQGWL